MLYSVTPTAADAVKVGDGASGNGESGSLTLAELKTLQCLLEGSRLCLGAYIAITV